MAQRDTHVALIILTTLMSREILRWKKLVRAKICVAAPSVPTSTVTQNKGLGTEAHFSNAPSAGVRPPLLLPWSDFQVALMPCSATAVLQLPPYCSVPRPQCVERGRLNKPRSRGSSSCRDKCTRPPPPLE